MHRPKEKSKDHERSSTTKREVQRPRQKCYDQKRSAFLKLFVAKRNGNEFVIQNSIHVAALYFLEKY